MWGGGPELLLVAVLGAIMICVGVPFVGGAVYFMTAGVKKGRRKVVIIASLLPVACVVWGASVLWVQGGINQNSNRDPGYGDMWACPLPNGYALMMIDDPDEGVLYNTKTQTLKSGVAWGTGFDDALGDVRTLQVEGPYIFVGVDSRESHDQVDSYFLLDARSSKYQTLASYDALRDAAQQLGFRLNMQGIGTVYSKYYFTWSERFMEFMLWVPPLLAFCLLVRSVIRLRRRESLVSDSA
jgi:hypothetical protein